MSKRSKALRTYDSLKPKSRSKTCIVGIIKILVLFFIIYQIISVFIISSFVVGTSAMEPGILLGQRLLITPIITGTSLTLPHIRIPGLRDPKRGDLIFVRPNNAEAITWYIILLDPIIRFFTLQKKTILPGKDQDWNNQIAIKRIIAIPGDTVKMNNFKFFIKPKSKTQFISEHIITLKKYSLIIPVELPSMDPSIPFSGNMDELKLSDNQYFVANDNRKVFYDSRFYGPVPRNNILGNVFLSYWPGISLK